MEFFATAAFGLEGLTKQELSRLSIEGKCEMGGVRFAGTAEQCFLANLWLRTADRVLLIVGEQKVSSFEELFQFVSSLPWEQYLPRDARFPVSGKCVRSQLMSVRDCQAITKKAIVERLKKKYRTDWFDEKGAEYKIDVSIHGDLARLTIDTSGTALNKRGYRTWNGEAPIRETLAAALVMLSPWKGDTPLWDPCCGTGTLLIEAAYIQSNRAPGLTRSFACEAWPQFPRKEMQRIREEAQNQFDPEKIQNIFGSDLDPEALSLCKKHLKQAGLGGRVKVMEKDLRDLVADVPSPCFIANPPYGERLSDRKQCEKLYRHFHHLKERHPGSRMCVITAHHGFERCFGERARQKRRLYNGRLECEYCIY